MARGSLSSPARVAAGCSQTAGKPVESAATAAQGGGPTLILTILIYTDYTHYTRYVVSAEGMIHRDTCGGAADQRILGNAAIRETSTYTAE